MAIIELKLQDGQNLGFVQVRNGEPYYGYSRASATEMPLTQAVKLCKKFSDSYECIIHRNIEEKRRKEHAKIIVV